MKLRSFGKTGKMVSEIGFGGMRFEKPDDLDYSAATVYHAFEKGVNYFDTAPYYCNDKSEDIVGLAIKQMKASGKPFFVASKTSCADAAGVRKELERSLKRLGVDAIDFYHVWCLLQPDELGRRKAAGALAEFVKAKQEGLIRHISVSTHLGHEYVEQMLDEGDGAFEGMLIGLNVTNSKMRLAGVQAAGKRGMGVATMNTLAGGLLADHPKDFAYIMREGDQSIIDAAIRFNLSIPEVSTALIGARNVGDVDTAIAAYERLTPLAPKEFEAIRDHVTASQAGFCTQCNYCDGCPQNIPVLRMMESYNHRILAGGDPGAASNRLKWHWGVGDPAATLELCTQCGQCVEACTQHLPIMERFEDLKADQKKMAGKKK